MVVPVFNSGKHKLPKTWTKHMEIQMLLFPGNRVRNIKTCYYYSRFLIWAVTYSRYIAS